MANMDEDQLLDYEEEQEEATDATKAENGTTAEKKIKVICFFTCLYRFNRFHA